MNTERSHNLRFRAALGVSIIYLSLVAVVAAVRLLIHDLGYILPAHGLAATFHVLVFHGVAALALGIVLVATRHGDVVHSAPPKLVLATMPVLFLVSIDRLATIPYAPFTEYHGMFMAHSTRDWTSRPGWSGPYQGVPARINCKGFRGSEVAPQPEPDEQRILFLGDSVAFGYRVREEDTLVNRVKELLSAEMTSKRVTTLNASIIGYSPWQEYDLLVNEGLSVHPHLIVQVFCLNDVLDKLRLKRFGGLTQGYTPIKPSTLEWSGLFRMARAFHDRRRMAIDRGVWFHRPEYAVTQLFTEPATEIVRRGWNITLESMRKIAAAAREASLPLLVVCVPSAEQLTPDPSYQPIPQRKLAALADREGFLFLDLLPVFQAYLDRSGARPSTLLFDTLHLTPAGHDLAATAVSQFVRQNDLIH